MWLTINHEKATEIEDEAVKKILNLYPEEKLVTRPVFKSAFVNQKIKLKDLKDESGKILIPWQMFLLSKENLNKHITHIEDQREYKVSSKLVSKRRGAGDITSKRILDRLISLQNFLTSSETLPINAFNESLKQMSVTESAEYVLNFFSIKQERLWITHKTKSASLDYLINQIQDKNINISRGVLTNKILPNHRVVGGNDIYKNTSGFVIKDEYIPFIFLPSETNPDEVESRQIYTLIYLVVMIGLGRYDYRIEKDFIRKRRFEKGSGLKKIFNITSEILLPTSESSKLHGTKITTLKRDELSSKYKVSPLALVTILHMRDVINKQEYEDLKPPEYKPVNNQKEKVVRSAHITTSVSKFCGKKTYETINRRIADGSLKNTQAQYLLFGGINKKGFRTYRNMLGI